MRLARLICLALFLVFVRRVESSEQVSVIAVVLACERSSHLKRTLRSLAKATVQSLALPVYVSVDEHPKSYRAVRAATLERNVKQVWQHVPSANYPAQTSRDRIARHYHFVLSQAFDLPENANVSHVLVLEDDLLFAPDFLAYMLTAAKHLTRAHNNTIVCASGWNDNGRHETDMRTARLTTFFPGLGWMLPRALWTHYLRPNWPGAPNSTSTSIVGIGWDFWLRIAFEAHGWACITPAVPRVFHFGATGSNVAAQETEQLFASSPLADLPAGSVDWDATLSNVADKQSTVEQVQERLVKGHLVKSFEDAKRHSDTAPVMPYLRESFAHAIAEPLKLWPTPRGHFHHTLLVQVAPQKDLLLYDARRAAKHFMLPTNILDAGTFRLLRAGRNASCEQECRALGLRCSTSSLEFANSCESLSQVMPDGCQGGCAYETGNDLPARVDDEAPLQTAGICLITETGATKDGRLDCKGTHEWTTRSCGCAEAFEHDLKDELKDKLKDEL